MANGWNCSRKPSPRLPGWPSSGNRVGGETWPSQIWRLRPRRWESNSYRLRCEALTILTVHSHERKATAPRRSLIPQVELSLLSNVRCWTSRRRTGCRRCTITCLLYTSDAADERSSVDLGGRRIIKKKKE